MSACGGKRWGVAFEKVVRRKPLAFAVDAVYGISIEFRPETLARSGNQKKGSFRCASI
jgi:hypothetical protein